MACRLQWRYVFVCRRLPTNKKREFSATSVKEGGTLIEYEDEDPEIRLNYEDTLKKMGVTCQMPNFVGPRRS